MPLIVSALLAGGSPSLPLPLTACFLAGMMVCLTFRLVVKRNDCLLTTQQWWLVYLGLSLSLVVAFAGQGLHALWIAPALLAGLLYAKNRWWIWGMGFGGLGLLLIGFWHPEWLSIPSLAHDGDGSIVVHLGDPSAVWRRGVDLFLLAMVLEGSRLWLDDDFWHQLWGTGLLGLWIVGALITQSSWTLLAGALALGAGLWVLTRVLEGEVGFFRHYLGTLLIGGGGILGAILVCGDLGYHPTWLVWLEFPLRKLAWNAVTNPDASALAIIQAPGLIALFAVVCLSYVVFLIKTDAYQPGEEFALSNALTWSGFGSWCCTAGGVGVEAILWWLSGRTIAQVESRIDTRHPNFLRLAVIWAGLWFGIFFILTPLWIYEFRLQSIGNETISEIRGREWIFKRSETAPAKAYLELREKIKIVHYDTGKELLLELQNLVDQASVWPELSPWAWKILADAAFIIRNTELYIQSLQRIIQLEYSTTELLEYCGDKLLLHASSEAAIPAFERAVYQNPYNPELRKKLAQSYRQARRLSDAAKEEQAILTLQGVKTK